MRTPRALLALLAFVAATGCASVGNVAGAGGRVQQLLDAVLPAEFRGDANFNHSNGYFRVTIRAGNLRRTERGWAWDWLVYYRKGVVSDGTIIFGSPPANLLPP